VLSLMGSFLGSYLWIEAVLVFFFWASKLDLLLVIRLGSTLSYINVLYWFRQRLVSFWAAFCNKIKMKIICVKKMFKWFQVSSLPFFGGMMVLLLKFNIQAKLEPSVFLFPWKEKNWRPSCMTVKIRVWCNLFWQLRF
jgi:hypothetical protein